MKSPLNMFSQPEVTIKILDGKDILKKKKGVRMWALELQKWKLHFCQTFN